MEKIKGVIFDLDGTLINSELFHFNCWNATLRPYKVELDWDTYVRKYAGVSVGANTKTLVNTHQLDIDSIGLAEQRIKTANEAIESEKMDFMPHAARALNFFKNKGVPLYLVTGSPRKLANQVLINNDIKRYFEFSITNDDVDNSKPHPEGYLKATKMTGFEDHEILVFEDTGSGVEAAKSAHLTCYAIQFNKELKKNVSAADKIFDDFHQALKHVEKEFF